MKTERSRKLVQEFRERAQAARKTISFEGALPAGPEQVYATLCPSRERDWIPGWECELIYTESGYAELDCVFRTGDDNVSGPGLWVCTRHEPPARIEYTRFVDHVVMHLTIELTDNGDGTTHSRWTIVLTGIDEQGNMAVGQIPDDVGDQHVVLPMLTHYLETGEMFEAEAVAARGHGHGGHSLSSMLMRHVGRK
jgi:hypothetical protein